jgi:hypothetical protein
MSKLAILSSVAAPLFGTPARPLKNEMIVTGAREAAKEVVAPNVAISRRADAVVATLIVSTDTGEYFDRMQALRKALRQIESRSASNRGVSVAFAKNGNVLAFSVATAEAAITSTAPPESSRATLLLRTPVVQSDTMDTAMARIYAFRNNLPRLPRIEYSLDPVPNLTMAGPGQHRKTVIEAISTEVRTVTQALGAGYAARIEGLEQRMVWRRLNDLEMSFFIPYRLEILPTGAMA